MICNRGLRDVDGGLRCFAASSNGRNEDLALHVLGRVGIVGHWEGSFRGVGLVHSARRGVPAPAERQTRAQENAVSIVSHSYTQKQILISYMILDLCMV